eukprot:TRINITY_DN28967_c0_g1_i1.p1 TRINITY_DN28967_c0_g1~~TRINITY_DN28967_c0_g1_i1.p1  ORF type:complete len:252 (+),score=39.45 TRINITY_DN28967_c0_g1_i1:189-944(+)
MPGIASFDPSSASLTQLISYGKNAAFRWRIEHPPFWEGFFVRLAELKDEIGLKEASRLVQIFARLRLVDIAVVDYVVGVLVAADGSEMLLDLREFELFQTAEALAVMRKPEAMAVLVRPLITRVHRLRVDQVVKLLSLAQEVDCSSVVVDLADAACRSIVEKEEAPIPSLAALSSCVSKLSASGAYRAGPRSGLELVFQHIIRRTNEAPKKISVALLRQVASNAREASCVTVVPALDRLASNHELEEEIIK